jgi:hypothetical protein
MTLQDVLEPGTSRFVRPRKEGTHRSSPMRTTGTPDRHPGARPSNAHMPAVRSASGPRGRDSRPDPGSIVPDATNSGRPAFSAPDRQDLHSGVADLGALPATFGVEDLQHLAGARSHGGRPTPTPATRTHPSHTTNEVQQQRGLPMRGTGSGAARAGVAARGAARAFARAGRPLPWDFASQATQKSLPSGRASPHARGGRRTTSSRAVVAPAVTSWATLARMSCSRSAMSHGGSPATRMSMCILFLADFGSGTLRKPIAGPLPSESRIDAPSA